MSQHLEQMSRYFQILLNSLQKVLREVTGQYLQGASAGPAADHKQRIDGPRAHAARGAAGVATPLLEFIDCDCAAPKPETPTGKRRMFGVVKLQTTKGSSSQRLNAGRSGKSSIRSSAPGLLGTST